MEKDEEGATFDIVMKDAVYDKLFCLMRNIKTLNNGNEIGTWLLGKWSTLKDGTLRLVVDKFIIPEQEVSSAGVDIEAKGMISTIRQRTKGDSPIIGHWHIHPFGVGKTDWSSEDEEKIADWMLPGKDRKIFVFMLSSLDELKARVEIVTETRYPIGKAITESLEEYDNLPVRRENSKENKAYLKELTKTIKSNVHSKVYPKLQPMYSSPNYNKDYGSFGGKSNLKVHDSELEDTVVSNVPLYTITRSNTFVRAKIKSQLLEFIDYTDTPVTKTLGFSDNVKEKGTLTMYGFMCKTAIEAVALEEGLSESLQKLEEAYRAQLDDYKVSNGAINYMY